MMINSKLDSWYRIRCVKTGQSMYEVKATTAISAVQKFKRQHPNVCGIQLDAIQIEYKGAK